MVNSRAGQQEHRGLAAFAPDHDLAGDQGDGPDDIGVEHGAPIVEPDIAHPRGAKKLEEEDRREAERGKDNEPAPCLPAARRDVERGDRMSIVAG